MEDDKQKKIIYIAVGLIVVVILGFYIYNWDFVMNGGFAETGKVDESWESFKKNFQTTFGDIKNRIGEAGKSATSTEEAARLIEILKNKIENQAATSAVK